MRDQHEIREAMSRQLFREKLRAACRSKYGDLCNAPKLPSQSWGLEENEPEKRHIQMRVEDLEDPDKFELHWEEFKKTPLDGTIDKSMDKFIDKKLLDTGEA
jgi:hypothetical protein